MHDIGEWEVPEYLRPLYQMWSVLGVTHEQVYLLHQAAEMHAEGHDDIPPNTVLEAFLKAPVDDHEAHAENEDRPFLNVHETLVTTERLLALLVRKVGQHVKSMDAVPPWWQEGDDLLADRPIMGWEIAYRHWLMGDDDGP